jgi:hypothetical protein
MPSDFVFKVLSIRTAHFCPEKSDRSMVFSGRSPFVRVLLKFTTISITFL